jgi:hypothetical protein
MEPSSFAGIAVFVMLLLNVENTPAFVTITTAHVTVGTLVLAAGVLLAIEASRHLSPGGSAG